MEKEYHYGAALLKLILCFEVVYSHFDSVNQSPIYLYPFQYAKALAVPCFTIMAFFFFSMCNPTEEERKRLFLRLNRLLLPHIGWTVVYAVALSILYFPNLVSFQQVIYQLLMGHTINKAMWYQVDLILLTILFFPLSIANVRGSARYSILIILASFTLEYSGINYNLFRCLPEWCSYTLGRLIEMAPYAAFGTLLAQFKTYRKSFLKETVLIVAVSFTAVMRFVIPPASGFGYSGGGLFVTSCMLMVYVFYFPSRRFSTPLKHLLKVVSKYTMGVYFMHILVGEYIKYFFECNDGFALSVIIYVTSISLAYFLDRVFGEKIGWLMK